MNRRSAVIFAAGLVAALMAGTVSRAVTFRHSGAAAPIQIVVQTPTSALAAAPPITQVERN